MEVLNKETVGKAPKVPTVERHKMHRICDDSKAFIPYNPSFFSQSPSLKASLKASLKDFLNK
jgi:hypothetical protein